MEPSLIYLQAIPGHIRVGTTKKSPATRNFKWVFQRPFPANNPHTRTRQTNTLTCLLPSEMCTVRIRTMALG